jgi:hypothetical protein
MATSSLGHLGAAHRSAAARLGALAGATPIGMFVAWAALSGWTGSVGSFVLVLAEIGIGAVGAGWIIGRFIDGTARRWFIGLLTYGVVGWMVVLPINAAGSTWAAFDSGRLTGPSDLLLSAAGYLLSGAVVSLYGFVYLLPFGAGWSLTMAVLRRVTVA